MKVAVFLLATSIWIFSCGKSKEEKMRRAQIELQTRIYELAKEKNEICRMNAIAKAEVYVDSIILTLDLKPMKDSVYHPDIPQRPKFVPIDSSVFVIDTSFIPIL